MKANELKVGEKALRQKLKNLKQGSFDDFIYI